jgi:hypothetical protein
MGRALVAMAWFCALLLAIPVLLVLCILSGADLDDLRGSSPYED